MDSPSPAPLTSARCRASAPKGTWQGTRVLVGNGRLLRELGIWPAEVAAADAGLAADGRGAVHVVVDGTAVATLGIADRPRESGPAVVRALRAEGVRHVAMLTGDSADAARAVAAAAGLDDVRAGLLPEDKLAAVADLRRRHGAVAMVGDGVNDAPALALADVGIAMGAIGSAAALESADIALMSDELEKIPYVLRLSRATLANIRTNVALSIGLKVAVLALAIAGAVHAVDGGAGRHRGIDTRRRKRAAFAPTPVVHGARDWGLGTGACHDDAAHRRNSWRCTSPAT